MADRRERGGGCADRRAWIPQPGRTELRPPGIPAVRDRTVQGARRHVLEPIFEPEFAGQSYGCRPGRGAKDALRRVDTLLKAGHDWVVDADLKSYFDTIPHDRLLALVRARVADGRVLALVERFLRAGVLEEAKGWRPTEGGTPPGGVSRPLLANLQLDPLDHQRERAGWAMRGGFDVLGHHFERAMRWPREKSLKQLKERVRAKPRRMDGRSLRTIVTDVNRTLRGWYGDFQHSKANVFATVDGCVRRSNAGRMNGLRAVGCCP